MFHSFIELLLELFGKLVVRVEFQGFFIVLHHIEIVTLAVLGRVLHNTHHVEETTKSTDIRGGGSLHLRQL